MRDTSSPDPLLLRLTGGDRRSIGQAGAVAAAVLLDPHGFDSLWRGLGHADALVRMRAADALEKVTRRQPAWLAPYKAEFLALLADAEQKEVRWHLAQMAPRLPLDEAERDFVLSLLKCHLNDRGSIVKTCAMQAIAELSADCPRRRAEAVALIESLIPRGTPAMKARGRKLLARLGALTKERP